MVDEHCQHHSEPKRGPSKLFIIACMIGGLYLLGFFIEALVPFRLALAEYFKVIWWAITLGLVLGGVIHLYVPGEYISKTLARPGGRTILNSVLLGFLMSACSHGILAIAMELYRKGASGPAVVSFLLASPWANLPLTILLIGFFGMGGGLLVIAGALIIAVITGFIFLMLEKRNMIEHNPHVTQVDVGFSIRHDIARRWQSRSMNISTMTHDLKAILKGAASLADMVLWWIVLGMGLAALAAAYVPPHFFHQYLAPTLGGLFATLLIAIVMEVCSEGTAPLAFEIYRQTGALGNSFVFLMGGVVTDYTEVGLVWHNIGKRTALWMIAIAVPQTILLGFLINSLI